MGQVKFNQVKAYYDIIIVGMGAAGCNVALHLAEKYEVLMVDYDSIPRKKVCSGILTRQAIGALQEYDLPEDIFEHPKYLDITYINVDKGTENHSKKDFLNTDRNKLDHFLLTKVKEKNHVQLLAKTKLVDFKIGDLITVSLTRGENIKHVRTQFLIGCDGAQSVVRKKMCSNEIPHYIAINETFKTKIKIRSAYFIFDSLITDFYYWIIPKSGEVEIGATLKPKSTKKTFALLKDRIDKKFGISGKGRIQSSLVLRPHSLKDIYLGEKNVFLCGEAAGLIAASSAEGISYALRSGKYCADALNRSQFPLAQYKKACNVLKKRLVLKLKKARKISDPTA